MIVSRSLLALGLLFPLGALANPTDDARDWLSRMSRAAHALNYQGTFVYEHMGSMQSMKIFHGADAGGERERLVTLDGVSREVIRDNDKVTCILPDDKAVVVDATGPSRPFPINLPTRLEQLDDYYDAEVAGAERVAGHAAQKIVIRPRDGYRYGQNVWLEQGTALLLKSELVDENGKAVERLMFTELEVHANPLPPALFEPQAAGADMVWYTREQEAAADAKDSPAQSWRVESLPPGFRHEGRRFHRLPTMTRPVEHLVYSDGLASVSVFIEQKNGDSEFMGSSRKGAVNVYAREHEGHRIMVIGEVPAATVRLIGDSVMRAEPAP
ncbi:MAG: MucB/RseB C-terminal domain-containing protein [Thiohalomonadaceae bacterium]